MIDISIFLFWFCVVVFFFSLAIRNSLPELAEAFFDDESLREQLEIPPPDAPDLSGPPTDPDELVDSVIQDHVVQGAAS